MGTITPCYRCLKDSSISMVDYRMAADSTGGSTLVVRPSNAQWSKDVVCCESR